MQQHKVAHFVASVVAVAVDPALGLGSVHVSVVHVKTVHGLALGIDQHGLAVGDHEVGVGLHHTNQALEELGVCVVVALGDPQVAAAGERGGLVPLGKGTPGIDLVGVHRPRRATFGKCL